MFQLAVLRNGQGFIQLDALTLEELLAVLLQALHAENLAYTEIL